MSAMQAKEKSGIGNDLTGRGREVFRAVVEVYLDSGSPVGSRTVARDLDGKISPATIRDAMQDLELMGLLRSPHVSAGRMPTDMGLRLFVDELLEVGPISAEERSHIDAAANVADEDVTGLLDRVGSVLSRLTHGASLVLAPKSEVAIKHIEFVSLASDRALVVMVTADGHVENRVFKPPLGQTPAALREAANFVNAIASGRTVEELRSVLVAEVERRRREIDDLANALVEGGMAVWEPAVSQHKRLIVRGRSNLIGGDENSDDLDRIRELFDDLERKRDIVDILDFVERGEGVRIFIGSENKLFSLSGSTLVFSPYMNAECRIVGAVGVIGPTRLNYGRIVPIVDYTAQLVGRVVSEQT